MLHRPPPPAPPRIDLRGGAWPSGATAGLRIGAVAAIVALCLGSAPPHDGTAHAEAATRRTTALQRPLAPGDTASPGALAVRSLLSESADHARPLPGATVLAASPDYALPLPGATVLALFRAPPVRWSAGHRGIDLDASPGAEVLAPAPGVVAFSGVVVDRSVVVLDHPDGRRTSLEPVRGTLPVGTSVEQGVPVGHVEDRTGHCARTCVHWGVRRDRTYVDPLGLLPRSGPVVLLPVPP